MDGRVINMEWDKVTDHIESVFNNRLSPLESRLQAQTQEIKHLMELAASLSTLVKAPEHQDHPDVPRPQTEKVHHKPLNSDRGSTGDARRGSEIKKEEIKTFV